MKETIYKVASFLTTRSGDYAECFERDHNGTYSNNKTLIENKGYSVGQIVKVTWDGATLRHELIKK